MRTHLPELFVPVLLFGFLGVGCGSPRATESSDPPPLAPPSAQVPTMITSTLAQRVTVTPAQPATGTNVTITSVLTNRGSAPVSLESRICGLNYAGQLTLTHPPEVMKCAGYSMNAPLAPGDSVVTSDLMRVTSGAGTYTLRVQQAVRPEGWAEVRVQVR